MRTKILLIALLLASLVSTAQNPAYNRLDASLDGVSHLEPGRFTYFLGLDVNYANGRFETFLQDDFMSCSVIDNSLDWGEDHMAMRYQRQVGYGTEYIDLKYFLEPRPNTPQIWYDGNDTSMVISKVVMTGTPDLIVQLFTYYWPHKLKLGGYQKGEIAHYQALGDYVSIRGVNPELYRIVIEPGNLSIDYYKEFNIQ